MPKDQTPVRTRIFVFVVLGLLSVGALLTFRSLDLRYLLADEIDQEITVGNGTNLTLPGGEAKVTGLPAQVVLGDYPKRGTQDLNYFSIPSAVSFYSKDHLISIKRIALLADSSGTSSKSGAAEGAQRFKLKCEKGKASPIAPAAVAASTEADLDKDKPVWLCLSKSPLVFISAPKLVLKSEEDSPSHCFDLLDTEELDRLADILIWKFTVVTAYSVDVLEYPIEYLLIRKPLSFAVGPSKFTIKPGKMGWKLLKKLPTGESIFQAGSVALDFDYAPTTTASMPARIRSYE
ncbi:MAG: hypothetical protein K2W95_19250 [Candidatus Obscuribacterales bacterium]|nr:hypothetical protein [Candidatus Obscuribacterales bacterium]